MPPRYVSDFEFPSDAGFTGSAGMQHVKGYARGGPVKKAMGGPAPAQVSPMAPKGVAPGRPAQRGQGVPAHNGAPLIQRAQGGVVKKGLGGLVGLLPAAAAKNAGVEDFSPLLGLVGALTAKKAAPASSTSPAKGPATAADLLAERNAKYPQAAGLARGGKVKC